jgi:N-acetylglucosamine-6-phosphate deacetylase
MKKPFDLQMNGYAGVDFNRDDLTGKSLHEACALLREDGTEGILATVITAEVDRMCARLTRLAELRARDETIADMIAGIHIEGPFLNESPGFIGAHPARAARAADPGIMERLLEAAAGLTRVVTLAPERDAGFRTTRLLAERGVCVSAGHCDPSLDQLKGAVDAGLRMFTHLGNGCPLTMDRHDNIIQRALSLHDRLWLCFIPDGVHVPFPALKNYLRCAGLERTIFVTDAIAASRLGPGDYTIGDVSVTVGEDLVARVRGKPGLAGSTVTVPRMVRFAREVLGLTESEMELVMHTNPVRALT